MNKFKVGDKVRYIGSDNEAYNFKGKAGIARPGKVFTITSCGPSYVGGGSSYNVKGSYIKESQTNWSGMEEVFELVVLNWREELQ